MQQNVIHVTAYDRNSSQYTGASFFINKDLKELVDEFFANLAFTSYYVESVTEKEPDTHERPFIEEADLDGTLMNYIP